MRAGPLSAEDLVAALDPGYRDWLDPAFRPALSRLCEAISGEAGLTGAGERAARTALIRALTVQAQVRKFAAAHPELAERSPGPVVVITGLHRSGTTLLQNLLAEHPGLRVPRLWELMSPAAADVTRASTGCRGILTGRNPSLILAQIRDGTVMEAPSLVAHGGKVWLFVSRSRFDTNAYRTDAWVAKRFGPGFRFSNHVMATGQGYGFGPGGAEVITDTGGRLAAMQRTGRAR